VLPETLRLPAKEVGPVFVSPFVVNDEKLGVEVVAIVNEFMLFVSPKVILLPAIKSKFCVPG
jgi:hypothetical protein